MRWMRERNGGEKSDDVARRPRSMSLETDGIDSRVCFSVFPFFFARWILYREQPRYRVVSWDSRTSSKSYRDEAADPLCGDGTRTRSARFRIQFREYTWYINHVNAQEIRAMKRETQIRIVTVCRFLDIAHSKLFARKKRHCITQYIKKYSIIPVIKRYPIMIINIIAFASFEIVCVQKRPRYFCHFCMQEYILY